MSKGSTTWFAATALAGLTFSLINADTSVAQLPGRGPGGPDGPGRGGPPNVAELFSRMDRNRDGKLTEAEVPEPVWNRLSHADANGDGGVTKDEAAKALPGRRPNAGRSDVDRPDGGRPAGPPNPNARSRDDRSRSRDARPPIEGERGESPRGQARGQRDASQERSRPAPPRSPNQLDRERSARPDNAHRGPAPFSPEAAFDRLDKNHDGSLSREEFKAVAEFHRGPQVSPGPQGPRGHRGPSGPPMARRGPGMRGGGPPWARDDRGSFHGPHRFQGGPPWARSGDGPHFNSNFAGPPWAHSAQRDRGPRDGAPHQGQRHRNVKSRDRSSHERERSPSRRPDDRDRTEANAPQSDAAVTMDESQSTSPSDDSVTSSTPAKASKTATLPL